MISPRARILIVRFKSLGDILLSSLVPREISRAHPDAEIDYLVDEPFEGISGNWPWIRRELIRRKGWKDRMKLMASLMNKYDLVLDMQGSMSSALLSVMASCGKVAGQRGKRASFLYDILVSPGTNREHTVETNLYYLAALDISWTQPIEVPDQADPDLLSRYCFDTSGTRVLIHPGARFAHKKWSPSRFRAVADALRSRNATVHILCGPGETISRELDGYKVVADVPAGDLMALMKAYDLFIGNDSGPMHFAAAAGCRVIAICGPTDIDRWRPYNRDHVVCSAPCECGAGWVTSCRYPDRWCMEAIGVDEVIAAALERRLE